MRGTGIILIASNYTKILILRQHTVNTFKQNVAHKKKSRMIHKRRKMMRLALMASIVCRFLENRNWSFSDKRNWMISHLFHVSVSLHKILHLISLNYEVSWVMWTQLITKTSSTHFKCCVEFFFNFKSNKSNQTHTNWIAVCSHSTVISSCLF